MSTIEEDVARVKAITAALSGPQIVWVYQYHTKHDEGFDLYCTQEQAKTALLEDLLQFKDCLFNTHKEYHAARKEILAGLSSSTGDDDHWFSYDIRIVS